MWLIDILNCYWFHKRIVTTTYSYHSVSEGTVLFTLAIGLTLINLDQTILVVPAGSICLGSGWVYNACRIKPNRSGLIQMANVNGLLLYTVQNK